MSQEPDSLGLDKPIKLGRVLKVPKITDELLFDRNRGIPYVINNYRKVSRAMRKNDKAHAQKVKESALSKSALHLLKVESEVRNLESVLQFYQLWCHGLFPRATFSDCTQMVRKYKSPRVRMYRRELIEKEIHRQKVEQGIITEDAEINDEDDDLYDAPDPNRIAAVDEDVATSETVAPNVEDDDDEDDWGFLSVRRRPNGLFVGDDDDEEQDEQDKQDAAKKPSSGPTNHTISDDEEDFPDIPDSILQQESGGFDDKYDDELEIMREMGM